MPQTDFEDIARFDALGHTNFTTSGAHDVIAIKSPQKNDLSTKEQRDRA